jgi:hypothetical protein
MLERLDKEMLERLNKEILDKEMLDKEKEKRKGGKIKLYLLIVHDYPLNQ